MIAGTGDDLLPRIGEDIEVGELRLLAQPESPRVPIRGKWGPVEVLAVWFGRDGERLVPKARHSALRLEIELRDFVREPGLDPGPALTIPRGSSVAAARLTSDHPQTVRLGARWRSRRTDGPEVRFLAAPPHGLVFHDLPSRVRGIGPLRRGISVGLVDDTGAGALSDEDLPVIVGWSSTDAGETAEVTIPAGHSMVRLDLDLPEPGLYSLTARAQRGQLVLAEREIEYSFAYWLAAVALAGGVLGAVVVAAFHSARRWWRTVVVGVVAAVVAVLLALFGLLGLLEAVLPGASVLQEKVPVRTSIGMLCIALLGGIAGETIIGLFAGKRPRAAEPRAARTSRRKRRRSSVVVRREERHSE